jgi:hypothetical protein
MATPLADRIRAQAQKTASRPMTPAGASPALSRQAAVSSTGKAAAPSTGLGQSNIAESVVATQAEQQQAGVAAGVQEAAETMGVAEDTAAVKQSGVESELAMEKLAADNHFNNTLAEFDSRIAMAATEHEKELHSLELKNTLQQQRLANAKYKQALEGAGRDRRLKSKEDFAIAMSQKGLDRHKYDGDEARKRKKMMEDYARGSNTTMADIKAALEKDQADVQAGVTAAQVGAVTSLGKTGLDAGIGAVGASEAADKDRQLLAEGSLSEAEYNKRQGPGAAQEIRHQQEQDKFKFEGNTSSRS